MSNINDKATITLQVNGQQAKQMLRETELQIEKTSKAIERMRRTGADSKAIKVQEKRLKELKAELERMQKQVLGVKNVFDNLDKATPKQLKAELRKLKKELDSLEPSTKVWDDHKRKIKQLEDRLSLLNGQVKKQKSAWSKFCEFMNNGAVAIVAVIAMYTQAISKLRDYVNDFTTMDEELANSVKYTRMTREEVESLNEAFKGIDTRLSREKLNELAQEAGRLGKNTVESVQGYVEAAQIINVALVDLGEGATQSIAKIANIFGVEELYGTKEAMLKVGSAVNHLSQNCTASKPYLVNFAQRMSGIGSTAKMTIPEILAFGAVLDANGQKVEMSSTAISNTIMKLFQQTSKFAQITGMDVQKFSEVLKNNTTEGLVMFLEQLKKVSGGSETKAIATLAPLFQDLGLNGARITQVLATLTQHLEELRWQIGEANQAFAEGTSASNEFEIFNNTAQAQLDKAKNRIHELSVELGEKLFPVMSHLVTTSSAAIKGLNVIVDHLKRHASEYSKLATLIGIYVGWLAAGKVAQGAYTVAVALSTKTVALFRAGAAATNALLPLLKVGFVALSNTVSYFSNGLEVNYNMQKKWRVATAAATTSMKGLNAAMKANIFIAVASAITAVVLALRKAKTETSEYQKKVKEAMKGTDGLNAAALKEKNQLQELFGILKGAKEGTDEYNGAKKKLIDQYGIYIRGLINEKGEITDLARAYAVLSEEIDKANRLRGINNAKQTIEDEYYKNLAEQLDNFKDALIKAGASIETASKIKTQVAQALAAGKSIPKEVMDEINKIAGSQFKSIKTGKPAPAEETRDIKGTPLNILDEIYKDKKEHDQRIADLDAMAKGVDKYAEYTLDQLEEMLRKAQERFYLVGEVPEGAMSIEEATKLIQELPSVIASRKAKGGTKIFAPEIDEDTIIYTPETDSKSSGERFMAEKAQKERRIAQAMINKALGYILESDGSVKEYTEFDYNKDLIEIDKEYFLSILKRADLSDQERQKAKVGLLESSAKLEAQYNSGSVEEEDRAYKANLIKLTEDYVYGIETAEEFNRKKEAEELRHLRRLMEIYQAQATAAHDKWEREKSEAEEYEVVFSDPEPPLYNSDIYNNKYLPAKQQYQDRAAAQKDKSRQEAEKASQAFWQRHDKALGSMGIDSSRDRLKNYQEEISAINDAYENEKRLIEDNYQDAAARNAKLLELQKAFEIAKLALAKKYGIEQSQASKDAVLNLAEWLNSEGGKAMAGALSTLYSGMSGIFSGVTSLMQADLDDQTKAIEERYQRELSAAEGNSYRIAKLEKEKEREIARIKSEANRRQFVMQVIQATAQTAQNAISAYGSAAAIPLVGHILAPIAASMAIAAGMLQIAAIKKQQKASESAGYASGGFTPEGPAHEAAGTVHKGEWVASQKLTKNQRVRPLLEALEYMQRYNVLPSISDRQVSQSITAPAQIIKIMQSEEALSLVAAAISRNTDTMKDVDRRLKEPSAAIVTVGGEYGIVRAQEEYNRYRRTPASKQNKSKWN